MIEKSVTGRGQQPVPFTPPGTGRSVAGMAPTVQLERAPDGAAMDRALADARAPSAAAETVASVGDMPVGGFKPSGPVTNPNARGPRNTSQFTPV
jgi:hypothetical protein